MIPNTLTDLQEMLVNVLSALVALHRAGFVHSDIRWPNVFFGLDKKWHLGDFESAAKSSAVLVKKDINQVGLLLNDCPLLLFSQNSPAAKLREGLLSENPPTAEQALDLAKSKAITQHS